MDTITMNPTEIQKKEQILNEEQKIIDERIENLTRLINIGEKIKNQRLQEIEVLRNKKSKVICRKCGHIWTPYKDNPERCPNCKTKYWFMEPKKYTCKKCGHQWVPRKDEKPTICPHCKTENWD